MTASKKTTSAVLPARPVAAAKKAGPAAGKSATKPAPKSAPKPAPEPPGGPQRIYQLHVELEHTDPPVWRRLWVPDTLTLGQLHYVLQCAMGWGNEHLHEFTFERNQRYVCADDFGGQFSDDFLFDEDEHDLGTLLGNRGRKRFRYRYDFGDNWGHQIVVEKRLPPDASNCHPQCTDGANACPPEDIGGPWGFQRYKEAIADPKKHPDYEHLTPSQCAALDPAKFDLKAVNTRLSKIKFE